MPFSADEIKRYQRHIMLKHIGGAGQQKLKKARVLMVGAGGLGNPVIAYLAAAGVGTLGIVDDDEVALSNLQRQIIYRTHDVGHSKADRAADFAKALNPHVTLVPHHTLFTPENGAQLIHDYDIIVDGTDRFSARQIIASACAAAQKPLVSAAVSVFDGTLSVFTPYALNDQGQLHPRFEDLYPNAPQNEDAQSCAQLGIMGPLTGIMGSLQAMEVIKLITGVGTVLVGRLLLYDGLNSTWRTIKYQRKKPAL